MTMKLDTRPGNSSDIFCLAFSSDPTAVRNAIQAVTRALSRGIVSSDELALIEIVLSEVTNNIVEHAYQEKRGQPIDLRVSSHQYGINFEIVDQGLAMPNGEIPEGVPQKLDRPVADLPEGGFGWPIIHQLASGLEYARVGDENHLRFYFSVRDSAETD